MCVSSLSQRDFFGNCLHVVKTGNSLQLPPMRVFGERKNNKLAAFTTACTRNTYNRLIVRAQVFGRFLVLFAVLRPCVEIHDHPIVYLLFMVWSLIEIFRYVSEADTHC